MVQVAKKSVLLPRESVVLPRGPAVLAPGCAVLPPGGAAPLATTVRGATIVPKTGTHAVLTHDDSSAIDRWNRKWFFCATLCLVALVAVALWIVIYTLRAPQKRFTRTPPPEEFRGRVVPVPVHPAGDDVGASDESSPRLTDVSYGDTVGDEGGFNATDTVGDDAAKQPSPVGASSDDYESS